ncbi:MAG: acyltransferase [Acetobacter okinawensis]|uniref:acyltransferase family protein n=1 Tax=Acetobacter okinawensis TaxID=1076594 RepID=UPI0039E7445C
MLAEVKQKNLQSLTSLRFFAALCVVIHHIWHAAPHSWLSDKIGEFGWLSVSFFFVLSGFVLMWSYKPAESYGYFVLKRIIRIYPIYIITLLISLFAFYKIHNPLGGYVGTPFGTFLSFFLLQDWVPWHPEIRQSWNGVSWTLSCELFFYLIAPILFHYVLSIKNRMHIVFVAFIWWASLLFTAVLAHHFHNDRIEDILSFHPIARLFEFFVGAVLGLLCRESYFKISLKTALFVLVTPFVCYCLTFTAQSGLRSSAVLISLVSPGSALLIAAIAQLDNNRSRYIQFLHNPVLVFLGEASFSLYMTHALFLGWYFTTIPPLFPEINASVFQGEFLRTTFLVYAVIISCLTYYFVELKIHKYLLGVIKNRRSL